MPRPIRPRTHERLRPPALLDAMRGTNDISCCLEVVVRRRCSCITTLDAATLQAVFAINRLGLSTASRAYELLL